MTKEQKAQPVRNDDYMAEQLEKRAAEVPSEAEACRRMAKIFRESGRTMMIRVQEVPAQKKNR